MAIEYQQRPHRIRSASMQNDFQFPDRFTRNAFILIKLVAISFDPVSTFCFCRVCVWSAAVGSSRLVVFNRQSSVLVVMSSSAQLVVASCIPRSCIHVKVRRDRDKTITERHAHIMSQQLIVCRRHRATQKLLPESRRQNNPHAVAAPRR